MAFKQVQMTTMHAWPTVPNELAVASLDEVIVIVGACRRSRQNNMSGARLESSSSNRLLVRCYSECERRFALKCKERMTMA